jgi:hypothetical protein
MDEPPELPVIAVSQAPDAEVISDQKEQRNQHQKQKWSRSFRELTNE